MYNPVFLDAMSHEQNRRLEKQRAIAQAYNQAGQKGMDFWAVTRALSRFLNRMVLSRLAGHELEEQVRKYYFIRKGG
jgi:UDP-N-acetyl-D-mannosaminuronic acid transferase (WecB/TagA/CpsF family)